MVCRILIRFHLWGCRDYAIVCIGLTMGFRAIDIVSLRFENIDWKRRSICLTQKKTGKNIALPMPGENRQHFVQISFVMADLESADVHVFIKHKSTF